eukprot:TRINITY_DN6681_c0_g2_i3.p1 TRINITY_DN6681_c0_g2~~TRINITY_DN6681_c0_g2_i3.p1  ORF type:complete len:761 (+),score=157.51 TRINITY_DN6681_c0_g2_i3:85-2367(+)
MHTLLPRLHGSLQRTKTNLCRVRRIEQHKRTLYCYENTRPFSTCSQIESSRQDAKDSKDSKDSQALMPKLLNLLSSRPQINSNHAKRHESQRSGCKTPHRITKQKAHEKDSCLQPQHENQKADSLMTYLLQQPFDESLEPRYMALLRFYSRMGHYREVELLSQRLLRLEKMHKDAKQQGYTQTLMNGLSQQKLTHESIEIDNQQQQQRQQQQQPQNQQQLENPFRQDVVKCLMHAYRKSGHYRRGLALFREYYSLKSRLDSASLTIVAHLCAGTDDCELALKILRTQIMNLSSKYHPETSNTEHGASDVVYQDHSDGEVTDDLHKMHKGDHRKVWNSNMDESALVDLFISAFCTQNHLESAIQIASENASFLSERAVCILIDSCRKITDPNMTHTLKQIIAKTNFKSHSAVQQTEWSRLAEIGDIVTLSKCFHIALESLDISAGEKSLQLMRDDSSSVSSTLDALFSRLLFQSLSKTTNDILSQDPHPSLLDRDSDSTDAASDASISPKHSNYGTLSREHTFDHGTSERISEILHRLGISIHHARDADDLLSKIYHYAQEGHLPDRSEIYNPLLLCLSRRRLLVEALQVLSLALDRSIEIHESVFNSILNSCVRLRQSALGLQVLEKMTQHNMRTNTLTQICRMEMLVQTGDEAVFIDWFDQEYPLLNDAAKRKYGRRLFSTCISVAVNRRSSVFAHATLQRMCESGFDADDFHQHSDFHIFRALLANLQHSSTGHTSYDQEEVTSHEFRPTPRRRELHK